MFIPEKILAECHAHGVAAYPEETCGFIVVNQDNPERLETVIPMRNIMNRLHAEDPEQFPRTAHNGYMIDPREHLKLERSLKKEAKKIKVIYHSHPDVGAYFSEKDKEDALWDGKARYPGITFLVCATDQGKPGAAILADFNENSGNFEITHIPAQAPFPASGLLGGDFGITGILPTIDFIHEWKNGGRELEYGYFRFVPPRQVRNFQQELCSRYAVRHALTYCSGQAALLELLSYLQDSRSQINLHLADTSSLLKKSLQSLEITLKIFDLVAPDVPADLPVAEKFSAKQGDVLLIAPEAPEDFVRKNLDWLNKFKRLRVPVIIFASAAPSLQELPSGLTYLIFGFNLLEAEVFPTAESRLQIEGGVVLSNNDRQMAELSELRKRRGAVLSARNAEKFSKCLLKEKKDTTNFSGSIRVSPVAGRDSPEEEIIRQLCKWENATAGFLFPTGMAAIMSILTLLRKKDKPRVVVLGLLYSESYTLLMDSGRADTWEAVFLGLDELDSLPEVLTDDTAMVITETITNPLCGVPDLERIGKVANAHGVPFVVDNTLASPLNCQPISWGVDFVIHSTTKYLSGANDHAGGAVLVKKQQDATALQEFQENWGLQISPLEAKILAERILDFPERMERFNANSLTIADLLDKHHAVSQVYHPSLPSHSSYDDARKILSGNGGVVSFVLQNDTEENLCAFYDSDFSAILKAPTLGSNQTLLCPYPLLTHYHDSDEELREIELPRYLLRIAVGSEIEIAPVLQDLEQRLATISL